MNPITGKKPLEQLTGFNGLFNRGAYDSCPSDHFTDCYNCIFPGKNQVNIRENFTVQNDIATRTIISFCIATVTSGAALLTLNANGDFWDETHAVLLINIPTLPDDFAFLNIFGRTYISFKKNGRGLSGVAIFYYNGTTLQIAGGVAPFLTLFLAQPNPGTVDPGVHNFSYSYITATGFVTIPAPVSSITSTGTNTVSISGIAVGPPGTIGRVLFATRANESELFFIPGGQINNNVTTTFEYTSFDSSLLDSADYLLNLTGNIESGAALKFYKGRMIVIGNASFPDQIYVSDISSPETINLVNNVINLPRDFGNATSSGGLIIRDVLYITKPNSTYSVQDNQGNPNTWGVSIVDSGIGAFDVGMSVFNSSMSAQDTLDSSIVANKRGLMYFNGTYADIALSYKIQAIWDLIDPNLFYKVQVAHDVWYKRVYVTLPLEAAATYGAKITRSVGFNNLILMMDYGEGLNPNTVKWSAWTFGGNNVKIAVENFSLNYASADVIYQLAIAQGAAIIYKLNPPQMGTVYSADLGHAGAKTSINQYVITHPTYPGGITNFTMLNLNFNQGYGAMTPSLYNGNRNIGPINYKTFRLDSYPSSIDLQRGINFQAEAMQVQLKADQSLPSGNQGYFWLTKLDIYGNVMFNMRPALVEAT